MKTENMFTCQMCKREFGSFANKAMYCPDCRTIRQAERNKKYNEKRMLGLTRHIGQEVVCEECGEPFIIRSGSQKVCENCRTKVTNRKKSKTNAKYTEKAYDYHRVYFPKGEKDKLKEIATSQNMSLNEFINTAIKYYLEHKK